MDFGLIEKAITISAKVHQGQFRKGTDIPYISHPFAVGMILMRHGYSSDVIAAGILHDTVEDTSITLNDIEQTFGSNISNIVAGCSEPNKELTWEDRKLHTIEFLKTSPDEVRFVACADKLHNVHSMLKNEQMEGPDFWNRFKRGKDKQAWYYRSIVESLEVKGSFPLVGELKKYVQQLFNL